MVDGNQAFLIRDREQLQQLWTGEHIPDFLQD
jgi:hypothetical protein